MLSSPFYPILDMDYLQRRSIRAQELLSLYEKYNFAYYQFRAKGLSKQSYFQKARELKRSKPALQLIANDHIEALGAPEVFCGLHLGQEDLKALSSKELFLLKKNVCKFHIGISTHNQQELQDVFFTEKIPWSYVAMGPCFETKNKANAKPVLALSELISMMEFSFEKNVSAIVLIGGLTIERIKILNKNLQTQLTGRLFPVMQSQGDSPDRRKLPKLIYAGISMFASGEALAGLPAMHNTGFLK